MRVYSPTEQEVYKNVNHIISLGVLTILYSQTHRKFTKSLFPFINTGLVDKVNHQIDSPTIWQHYLNVMQNDSYKRKGLMKNPYDIFNLTGGGHRKHNHDLLTGSLLGSVQAIRMGLPPSQGMMAAFSHYATDSLSNKMVNHMGVEGRNIFEAVMSLHAKKKSAYRQRGWYY